RPGRGIPKPGLLQRTWRFEQTLLLWCCKCPATPAVVPLGYSFPCRGAHRLSPPLEDIGRSAICKFRRQNHGGHSHARTPPREGRETSISVGDPCHKKHHQD